MSSAAAPDLARIPAGEFLMGFPDANDDERPAHHVFLAEYLIGRLPVTQSEYARFIRATGYQAPAVRDLPLIAGDEREAMFKELAAPYVWHGGEPPAERGNHPVVLVKYEDATAYCQWLSDTLGRVFRVPTEAEWEKAARGGLVGQQYPWGDEIGPAHCNFLVDPSLKHDRGTTLASKYPPNGYGLHDMSGNVWEWVSDWYGRDYYAVSEAKDPLGPSEGVMRLVRGGSWVNDDVSMLRCAYRHQVPPDTYAYSLGFRVVCTE
jgi:formylglycine-generating enzyme required for sulfatase activity